MTGIKLPSKVKHSGVKSVVYPIVFGLFVLTLWQTGVLHKILNTTTTILPLPTKIIEIIGDNAASIWKNTADTLSVIIPGLIIGSIIGYLLSVLACNSPRFGATGLTVTVSESLI